MFASVAFGAFLDAVELVRPETLEHFSPIVNGFKLLAIDAVKALAAFLAHGDQADLFEDAEVFGDHGLRPAEVMDEAIDRHLTVGEGFQHTAALGLGDGVEGVEGGWGTGHIWIFAGTIFPYG